MTKQYSDNKEWTGPFGCAACAGRVEIQDRQENYRRGNSEDPRAANSEVNWCKEQEQEEEKEACKEAS